MKKRYFIVIPPYYSGTSFEDIVRGLQIVSAAYTHDVQYVGFLDPLEMSESTDVLDDTQYLDGQVEILQKILHIIRQSPVDAYTTFLFIDFFNPGLDLLRYAAEQRDLQVSFSALLHGGSFVKGDLYSFPWMNDVERGWFGIYDVVYASSEYLSKQVPIRYANKVVQVPWGLDAYAVQESEERIYDVVFPHRLQEDKGVEEFITFVKRYPDVRFLVTSPLSFHAVKRSSYVARLQECSNVDWLWGIKNDAIASVFAKSKCIFSCSEQETFGYSVLKAVASGVIPIVPRALSYPEYIPEQFLYSSLDDAYNKIQLYTQNEKVNNSTLTQLRLRTQQLSFSTLLDHFLT